MKQYIDERVVAKIRGCGVQRLRNERHLGKGIPYVKDGRSVRYDQEDVIEYMEKRKIRNDEV
jgi:hypothetical protein